MDAHSFSILSGYVADLLLGDPQAFPHPVRIMGGCIRWSESRLRKWIRNEKAGGMILASLLIGGAFLSTFLIVRGLARWHPVAGVLGSIFLIYTTLSVKDLATESLRVYDCLVRQDIESARTNLALIVGRDTNALNEKEIIRATVETIAENIVDGIVSPLFFAFIGGAPLAMAYKAVSTLDSMVGYKNEKYKHFGWASARIDDAANFIPARITGALLPLAAWLCRKNGRRGWDIMRRDGHKNPSLNSGIPEAAVAGALGVRLGGLNFYFGQPSLKPYVGEEVHPLAPTHITDTIKIMYTCSFLALVLGYVLYTGLIYFTRH